MKRFVLWGNIALGVAVLAGCLQAQKGSRSPESGVIYRHHFLGTAAIASGTNATKLKEVLALNASKTLRSNIVDKLAHLPAARWPKNVTPESAELLRPLLDDLATHESYVEVRGPIKRPEWVFAIAIPDARDKVWTKNLKSFTQSAKLAGPKIQVTRAGQWTLVGIHHGEPVLFPELVQKARQKGRPVPEFTGDALLELEADTPRLATVLPVLAPLQAPPMQFTVFGRGENLRTEGKFRPSQKFAWNFEPWLIPTNSIPDTIISFTVAQGIAPLLKNIKPLAELGFKPLPNQFTAWGLDTVQVQTCVAIPVKDATNTIKSIAPNVPKLALTHLEAKVGQFAWASNQAELHWVVPLVAPAVLTLRDNEQDYIFMRLFPSARATNKPPAELFQQLGGRKDLAYYDWEVTGQRLVHAKQCYQLRNIFARRQVPDEKSPVQQWLGALSPLLGNSITELTVASNQELNLTRKSHIGLTGFELATLALWLDSPSFPFRIEPRPMVPTNAPARRAATAPSKSP